LRRPGRPWILHGMSFAQTNTRDTKTTVGEARVGLTREEVMTVAEVSELLQMPVSTVYHLARHGVLPACRLGRTWRFLRPELERVLRS
jgi:excisionase family DNA binding protein